VGADAAFKPYGVELKPSEDGTTFVGKGMLGGVLVDVSASPVENGVKIELDFPVFVHKAEHLLLKVGTGMYTGECLSINLNARTGKQYLVLNTAGVAIGGIL